MSTIARAKEGKVGSATMRAAVLTGPGQVRIEDRPVPQPGPGQVRVRMESCGVCGSNIPVWEGREWFRYPLEPGQPGHEGCGWIDALGPGLSGLEIGQRVGVLSYHAFAQYDFADAAAVVPLPAALDGQPCPAEALGCAMNVYRRSGIAAGNTVAVVGAGFMGLLVAQLARADNARVIAVSRRRWALSMAEQAGIGETVALDGRQRIIDDIKERTGGRLCDVVIEAAGAQETLDLSAELTRERGRLVIAGFHQDGPRRVDLFLWNWRGLDVVNAHERDPAVYVQGMRLAVEAVASSRLNPGPLYTHSYPLERLGEALDAARSRPDGFMKAIVRM